MLSVCSSDCLFLENVIFKVTVELIETLGSKAYKSEMWQVKLKIYWRKTEVVVPVRAEL